MLCNCCCVCVHKIVAANKAFVNIKFMRSLFSFSSFHIRMQSLEMFFLCPTVRMTHHYPTVGKRTREQRKSLHGNTDTCRLSHESSHVYFDACRY